MLARYLISLVHIDEKNGEEKKDTLMKLNNNNNGTII
jgi:hypothetical protein